MHLAVLVRTKTPAGVKKWVQVQVKIKLNDIPFISMI